MDLRFQQMQTMHRCNISLLTCMMIGDAGFFFLNKIVHIATLFFLNVRQFLNQKGFSDKSTEIYGTTSSQQHSPNFVLYGHIKMNAYFTKYYSLRRLRTRMVVIQNITENHQRLKCQNSITTPICKYYLLLKQFFCIFVR